MPYNTQDEIKKRMKRLITTASQHWSKDLSNRATAYSYNRVISSLRRNFYDLNSDYKKTPQGFQSFLSDAGFPKLRKPPKIPNLHQRTNPYRAKGTTGAGRGMIPLEMMPDSVKKKLSKKKPPRKKKR